MKTVVVSIHDVAPLTAADAAELRARVAARAEGPVSLLVVPRPWGRETWRHGAARSWLRGLAAGGDELVQHGYSHLDAHGRDGFELRGRAPADVAHIVREGRDELAEAIGAPQGFIPPSYAGSPAMERSCRAAGLSWWAGRTGLRWPGGGRRLPSFGLGASTAPRRALSPRVARAAAVAAAPLPTVRLDLHPADLRHPGLEGAIDDLLERLLAQGRRLVTHAELVGRPDGR